MRKIGIGELNQNTSQVVRSVERDGPVVITIHGRAVARIVPEPENLSRWDRLVQGGMVEPARNERPYPVPVKARSGRTVAAILAELKADH
ncbi:MAG: type II toxin-antitoxin system prevent-host-death family antitoxin [Actinomycetota bacterium]|nr:type II toxin-antitoxin system prevent-host-death family antitoxin [Actinomycetota bacterium]MDQ2852604.1 type II toxin-antitoxin system prevent-host-death family antitoxin [Actinomycetota bacterium]